MKKLFAISVLLVFVLFPINSLKAEIVLQGEFGNTGFVGPPLTEMSVESLSGEIGDYEIFFCGINSSEATNFNNSIPNWTSVNIGGCAGSPDCLFGIWNKFSDNLGGVVNKCSWTFDAVLGIPGIFRYRGVDPDAPVISSSCNTGVSAIPIAPGVDTEANSVVIRFFVTNGDSPTGTEFFPPEASSGLGFLSNSLSNGSNFLFRLAYGEFISEDGFTPTASIDLDETASWRACSVALRAEPAPPTEVPTLSEWGLIALAGVLGVIGLIVIRRRKVTA